MLTLVDRCKPPGHKRFWDRSLYGQGVLGVQRSNHELSLTLESAWDKTWQIQALPEYFRKKKWRFEGRQQGALMRRDTARPTVSPGCTPPGGTRMRNAIGFSRCLSNWRTTPAVSGAEMITSSPWRATRSATRHPRGERVRGKIDVPTRAQAADINTLHMCQYTAYHEKLSRNLQRPNPPDPGRPTPAFCGDEPSES